VNDGVVRIAMWSGPRNISTALLRAWENRADTLVCDEPLYAHYLSVTAREHPGSDEVIAAGDTDWTRVVGRLVEGPTGGKTVFYQKHMGHHLLPHMGRDWLLRLENALLIRDPREMLLSLVRNLPDPRIEDTGLPQQVEVLDLVRRETGKTPPVLDARDVLEHPRRTLELLCDALGVEFSERMLSWPAGPRPTDGVWAKHWYREVERSTGFAPWKPRTGELTGEVARLYEECLPYYRKLAERRLRA